ncbi:MAG: hypothetical protein IKJ09_08555 [Bacteroidaceae bacterium]|nr:hypothetical protein [Bacteroidaceae bacterium]
MKFRTVIYTLLLTALCMGCGGHLSMYELEHLEARINGVSGEDILGNGRISVGGENGWSIVGVLLK